MGLSILAIDPGTTESAFVVWKDKVCDSSMLENDELAARLRGRAFGGIDVLAVEMIASYGMPVGKEVFETCVWIGIFKEAAKLRTRMIYRRDVKIHLCGSARAKDGNIRQALIDKYGPVGTKKEPGLLYGISGHLWAAVAVADYANATNTEVAA